MTSTSPTSIIATLYGSLFRKPTVTDVPVDRDWLSEAEEHRRLVNPEDEGGFPSSEPLFGDTVLGEKESDDTSKTTSPGNRYRKTASGSHSSSPASFERASKGTGEKK